MGQESVSCTQEQKSTKYLKRLTKEKHLLQSRTNVQFQKKNVFLINQNSQ